MTEDAYALNQEKKFQEYENLCKRCGACCGLLDADPCENLVLDKDKKCFCKVYTNRFGLQKTLSGKYFLCVPIRKVLSENWTGSETCNYKRQIKL